MPRRHQTSQRLRHAAACALLAALLPAQAPAQAQTSVRTSAVQAPAVQTSQVDPPASENKELVRALQRELKRVGCLDGEANGTWGDKSRAAFQSFVRHAKLGVEGDEPNVAVLDAAMATRARVCAVAPTLNCEADQSMVEGRCVARPRQVQSAPAKEDEPKSVTRTERPTVQRKEASEPRMQREPRRASPQREARSSRETWTPRESPNAGKRLCFGAARNELVACN